MPFDATSTYSGAIAAGDTGSANLMNSQYVQKAASSSDLPNPGNAGVLGMTTEGEFGSGGTVAVFIDNGTSFEYMGSFKGLSGAIAHHTGSFALSSGAWTDVEYDTEDIDSDGYYSTASTPDRFTIPSGLSGVYMFTFNGRASSTQLTASARAWARILLNGSSALPLAQQFTPMPNSTGGEGRTINASISGIYDLTSGDFLGAQIYSESIISPFVTEHIFGLWKVQ